MISTERTITVNKDKSEINEPIILYRGDYEIEVVFTILGVDFKFENNDSPSFGQLAILTPYGGGVFSSVVTCFNNTISFIISKSLIDQIEEVGSYSFQIRLFDSNRISRVSIPPIELGIEIREPVTSEDHINVVNSAIVGYSIAKVINPEEEYIGNTFDNFGNYNKTEWSTGDRITQNKLNKIEDAIDTINKNDKVNLANLDKKIQTNFNVLESAKADVTSCVLKGRATLNDFDEASRNVLLGGTAGELNAVLGIGNVLSENIADEAIQTYHMDKTLYKPSTGYRLYTPRSGSFENASAVCFHYTLDEATVSSITFATSFIGLSDNISTVSLKIAVEGPTSNVKQTPKKSCANGEMISVTGGAKYTKPISDIYVYVWVESVNYTTPNEYAISNYVLRVNNIVVPNLVEVTVYNLDNIAGHTLTTEEIPSLLLDRQYGIDMNARITRLEEKSNLVHVDDVYRTQNKVVQSENYLVDLSSLSKVSTDIYSNNTPMSEDVYIKTMEIPVIFEVVGTMPIEYWSVDKNGIVKGSGYVNYPVTDDDVSSGRGYITINMDQFHVPADGYLLLRTNSKYGRLLFQNTNTSIRLLGWDVENGVATNTGDFKGEILYKLSCDVTTNLIEFTDDRYVNTSDFNPRNISGADVYIPNTDREHNFQTGMKRMGVSKRYYAMPYEFDDEINITKIEASVIATTAGLMEVYYAVLAPNGSVPSMGVMSTQVETTGTSFVSFDNLNIILPKGAYIAFQCTDTNFVLTYDNRQPNHIRSVEIGTGWSFNQDIEGTLNIKFHYTVVVPITEYMLDFATDKEVPNMVNDVLSTSVNRLFGKKIIAIGDSMVQGHSISPDEGWLAMIASRNNMTYINYGINGRYMTNKTYNEKLGVVDSFQDMEDADYIVVFAGTNDAGNDVTIGDDASINPAEFKGALNIICDGLLTKYPTKHIMFITPYLRDERYPAYIEAIETICEKYSIPVFNNAKNGGICWSNAAQVEALTLNDNLHLNLAGLEYASYKYEAFLRTL